MKVLLVNKLYHPHIGGVETIVQQIAEGLKDRVSLKVLVCATRGKGSVDTIAGIEVVRASSLGMYFSMPLSLSFFSLFKTLSHQSDIIHFHEPFPLGVLACLLMRPTARIIVSWHSDIVRQRIFLRFYGPLLRRFLKKADRIIVATEAHIDNSAFLRPVRHKCTVIPFGVNLDRFILTPPKRSTMEEIRKTYGPSLILFVGRLVYYKGVDVLVKAMKNTPGRLLLIGTGPLKGTLEALAAELAIQDRVVFIPPVPDELLTAYYHACDLLVLPSVALSEAFGIVQIEAMACGKPVVNTMLKSGVPLVSVDGETGITVPPGDVDALSRALTLLLSDTALSARYGQNAKNRVERFFTLTHMLNGVYSVYHKAVYSSTIQNQPDDTTKPIPNGQ